MGAKRAENRTVPASAGDVQKAGKQMPAKSHADVKENSLEKSGQSQSSHENGKMQRSAKIQGNGKLQSNAKPVSYTHLSLTAKESGRIGGLMTKKRREMKQNKKG